MDQQATISRVTPITPLGGSARPARAWIPIPTEAHDDVACVFNQTRSITGMRTQQMEVLASRGFSRAMPPTCKTKPSMLARRYTIDAFCYSNENERRSRPQIAILSPVREMEEPLLPSTKYPLPVPLRYHSLSKPAYFCFPERDEETFLELEKALITNDDFLTIMELTYPHAWFRDSVLDAALEIVATESRAADNEIGIASSMVSQVLNFIAESNDISGEVEYKNMLSNKKWIFVPINDGTGQIAQTLEGGSHWSLLAVDRVRGTAHYIDSLYSDKEDYQRMGYTTALGLGNLLGEKYDFYVEHWSPDQWVNNAYTGTDEEKYFGWDAGPCGPFVVSMISELVDSILVPKAAGKEEIISFRLNENVPEWFGKRFNSFRTRGQIQYALACRRMEAAARQCCREHDAAALAGVRDVQILDEYPPGVHETRPTMFPLNREPCVESRKESNDGPTKSNPGYAPRSSPPSVRASEPTSEDSCTISSEWGESVVDGNGEEDMNISK